MAAVEVSVVAAIQVDVVFSPASRLVRQVRLTVPPGSSIEQVLAATQWPDLPDLPVLEKQVGIWGRRATLQTAVRDQDRVEVYRSLKVDPKEARRVRYRAHGEKLPKGYHRPKSGAKDMTQAPTPRPRES